MILQDPIWAALQGIEVGSINDVLKMSDSDADGVWEVTFTVNGPAYYGITYSNQYRTAAGQIVNEGGGFGFGRYRTRYIAGFDDGSWPTAFELGIDHFNVVGPPLVVEDPPPFGPVGVGDEKVIPLVYALEQNYPNPFNPSTLIEYSIPEVSNVKISIYNLLGQELYTERMGSLQPGNYEFKWNGIDNFGKAIATGVYFYKIDAGSFSATKKMILMK